ncbi:oligosaccharyltransferase complex subunit epsilon [Knufia obscura]|uniref:Dolichyl-diphosphooligosaccharide--protein glycosyltransferase subunit OST2 n=2 Tax=Knufia TaxID=430999 RepID=A0AAN8ELP8_9EURO|nr:oligosaccharyltransferase complex subunit epsilon [Knufia obscura]KAK5949576.1 oligosaccharyltransferase complex subunit epsilon [Knufia fluminis]
MAKKPAQPATPKAAPPATTNTPAAQPTPRAPSATHTRSVSNSSLSAKSSPQEVALHVWHKYLNDTPTRTMLLDVFMLFLVLVGAVQFLYCLLVGNYPFNAFLSGFGACVGQFVLTASLRMQTSERPPPTASAAAKKAATKFNDEGFEEKDEDGKPVSKISSERAFADYVLGSLILHAFCVNFIN